MTEQGFSEIDDATAIGTTFEMAGGVQWTLTAKDGEFLKLKNSTGGQIDIVVGTWNAKYAPDVEGVRFPEPQDALGEEAEEPPDKPKLRDRFAGLALMGIVSYYGLEQGTPNEAAVRAYECADAMLAARADT